MYFFFPNHIFADPIFSFGKLTSSLLLRIVYILFVLGCFLFKIIVRVQEARLFKVWMAFTFPRVSGRYIPYLYLQQNFALMLLLVHTYSCNLLLIYDLKLKYSKGKENSFI